MLNLSRYVTRKGNVTSENCDAWIWLWLVISQMSLTCGYIPIQCINIFPNCHAFLCLILAWWHSCHWGEMICILQHLMTLILRFKNFVTKCYQCQKSRHIILGPRGWCLGHSSRGSSMHYRYFVFLGFFFICVLCHVTFLLDFTEDHVQRDLWFLSFSNLSLDKGGKIDFHFIRLHFFGGGGGATGTTCGHKPSSSSSNTGSSWGTPRITHGEGQG